MACTAITFRILDAKDSHPQDGIISFRCQCRIDEVVQYIVSDSGIFCFYLFGTIVVTDAIVVRYGIDRI